MTHPRVNQLGLLIFPKTDYLQEGKGLQILETLK